MHEADVGTDAALPELRRVREAEKRRDKLQVAYRKTVEAQMAAADLVREANDEVSAAWDALQDAVRSGVAG